MHSRQIAARWAQGPTQRLVALTNLGAAHWARLGHRLAGSPWSEPFARRDFLHFGYAAVADPQHAPASLLDAEQLALLREAQAYFDEAVAKAAAPEGRDDPNPAASACAPNTHAVSVPPAPSASASPPAAAAKGSAAAAAAAEIDVLTARLEDVSTTSPCPTSNGLIVLLCVYMYICV